MKSGGRIYSDAGRRILVENGRATGVEGVLVDRATKQPRRRFRVDADLVVLAGGALGTAELLLRNFDDPTVGRRFYINPHFWVFADFGREIDNVSGIPCAYVVHEWRLVRRTPSGEYAGGGYIMLTSHQSPGITATMFPETGAATGADAQVPPPRLAHVRDRRGPSRAGLPGRRRAEDEFRLQDRRAEGRRLPEEREPDLPTPARGVWIPDVYGTVRSDIQERITARAVQTPSSAPGATCSVRRRSARTRAIRSPGRQARRIG